MKKKIKVLHLLNELRFSGAETMLTSASGFLMEYGEHYIISTGENVGEYAHQLEEKGYSVHHIPFHKSPQYFTKLFKYISNNKFDLVHIHAERAFFLHAVIAIAAGAKCLRTIHSNFLFNGHLLRIRRVERRICSFLGVMFIACSSRVQKNELERFSIKASVINNWFDPIRIRNWSEKERIAERQKLGYSPNDFVIVSIGNSGSAKNHEAIAKCVIESGKQLNLHYIHCGKTDNSLLSVPGFKESDRIVTKGVVLNIDPILAICDAFVCTSFYEGGPIALLEAGAAGCPCITTLVPLAEELQVEPAVHIIEPNAESLTLALTNIRAMPRQKLRDDAQSLAVRIRRDFSPKRGAYEYFKAYTKVLALDAKFRPQDIHTNL